MLNIKKVINLSGKMSILGVSKLSKGVQNSIVEAANSFYVIKEVEKALENQIKEKFNSSDSFVTASASAAIIQSILGYKNKITNGKNDRKLKVLLPYGHHINYGAPIKTLLEFAGAEVIGIGSKNSLTFDDLDDAMKIDFDLAFFISSHYCEKNKHLSAKEYISYFKNKGIPIIIDIAAEEDIWEFSSYKANMSIISGSKSISGPTSGFILIDDFNKENLQRTRENEARSMKISKGNLFGLSKAIEEYSKKRIISDVEKNIDIYIEKIKKISTNKIIKKFDESRGIPRIEISGSREKIEKLNQYLVKNKIYVRNYGMNNGVIELDLRQVDIEEMDKFINVLERFKDD